MQSLSLRLRYRPLRIGWCVEADDIEAVRKSVRLTYTMWGGRYNPIIPTGDLVLAQRLVDLFRVDALVAASDAKGVADFIASQKHLPWPLLRAELFVGDSENRKSRVVDIQHPALRAQRDHLASRLGHSEFGIDLATWDEADPLADILLCTYGGVPQPESIGLDYEAILSRLLIGRPLILQKDQPIPPPAVGRLSLAALNRQYLNTHYSIQNTWGYPGFYVGDVGNFEDLVAFWNIKATGAHLFFHDTKFENRLGAIREFWIDAIQQHQSSQAHARGVTLWHRRGKAIDDRKLFGERTSNCVADGEVWNGLNIQAPIVYFSEVSALTTIDETAKRPYASFALLEKPFEKDATSYGQNYVLSVEPISGLRDDEQVTLNGPFIPGLNEFYGRNLHHAWNRARSEPSGVGFVTDVTSDQASISAVDVVTLVSAIFESVGINAKLSKAGLVAKTLISQMGGIDSCRPFKIAGVRKLIEDHRPDQSFSRSDAMQTIRGEGTNWPLSSYQWLYIEARPPRTDLTNSAVLAYLLERDVFRAGLKFTCPGCQLDFWVTLDDARSELDCEYCGREFVTGPQLKDKDWAFRRSGLFGRADHQEGALPVTLTLQQLLHAHAFDGTLYTTALQLGGGAVPTCETDFVVVTTRRRDNRIQLAIGECKTRQPISESDVANLRAIADAFPKDRYDVFIVFAKLAAFSEGEIALIRTLNVEEWQRRTIIFTDRELEPYSLYERTEQEFEINSIAVSLEDMAAVTHDVFFEPKRKAK